MVDLAQGLAETPYRAGDGIVAAVSGGADSMAMLDGLVRLPIAPLTVVHVHHGIRGAEADRDAALVESWCASHGISCRVYRVDIPAQAAREKIGLEECGRRVRYQLLAQTADEVSARWIATAHTLSDQAETVLLNLTRGAGPAGLCGIPRVRGRILRPLLSFTRAEIEAYCAARQLPFVQDSTNGDDAYARNRIRNQVIPALRTLNPQLEHAVLRMTRQMQAEHDFVVQTAAALCASSAQPDGWRAVALADAPSAVCSEALRQICAARGIRHDLSDRHIAQLTHVLRAGGAVDLPGSVRIQCSAGILSFAAVPVDEPTPLILSVSLPIRAKWCGRQLFLAESCGNAESAQKIYKKSLSDSLDYDTITKSKQVQLRSRRPGDEIRPVGRGITKTVKKFMNEAKIPADRRSRIAILEVDGRIAWVEGLGTAEWAAPTGPRQIRIWMEELPCPAFPR